MAHHRHLVQRGLAVEDYEVVVHNMTLDLFEGNGSKAVKNIKTKWAIYRTRQRQL